jgi:hypothetical protein
MQADESWPWAPGMEYKHVDVSWLLDFSRPSTVLHGVVSQRIAEQRVKREDKRLQQGTQELFLELQKITEAQFSEPNVMPERYVQVNKFDLWQREVAKYLKLLLHDYR